MVNETLLEIDHVAVIVADLEVAADQLRAEAGLVAVEGGRHPGHGTANYIAPLGENYIELVSVVDRDEAKQSPFGTWVADRLAAGSSGVGLLSLRSSKLDLVCSQLGLVASEMSRARPDGSHPSWRVAGIEAALETSGLPFYIEWPTRAAQPGRSPAKHEVTTGGLVGVTLSGDLERLRVHVLDAAGVSMTSGDPGILEVLLEVDGAALKLGDLF